MKTNYTVIVFISSLVLLLSSCPLVGPVPLPAPKPWGVDGITSDGARFYWSDLPDGYVGGIQRCRVGELVELTRRSEWNLEVVSVSALMEDPDGSAANYVYTCSSISSDCWNLECGLYGTPATSASMPHSDGEWVIIGLRPDTWYAIEMDLTLAAPDPSTCDATHGCVVFKTLP